MYATDFEYDGHFLSEFDFVLCRFDESSDSTISAGSQITFSTVSRMSGKYFSLAGTQYESCIQSTFNICKNPCSDSNMEISDIEFKNIMRWLNRREFLKFRLLDENASRTCYFDASFNIQKILIGGKLYGIELTMETNRPFGYGEQLIALSIPDTSQLYEIEDVSDEIGYLYPDIKITCLQSGDLTIRNEAANCFMVINNCTSGEVISIRGDAQIIETSSASHKIYDDFNFDFFRISNTYENNLNSISVSLPCDIEIKYHPIIKDAW